MGKNRPRPSGKARRDAFLRKMRDIKRKQQSVLRKKGDGTLRCDTQ